VKSATFETASIAINASLTGHLVFSTLHTNDAPGAVTRLIDIGVKPFLVASSRGVSWRNGLSEKFAKNAPEPYQPTEQEARALQLTPDMLKSATPMKDAAARIARTPEIADASAFLKFLSLTMKREN